MTVNKFRYKLIGSAGETVCKCNDDPWASE